MDGCARRRPAATIGRDALPRESPIGDSSSIPPLPAPRARVYTCLYLTPRHTNSFSLNDDTTRATPDFGGCGILRSSIVMDRVNIPTCALHRQSTTVIVRIKMEVPRCCGQSEGCPVTDGPKIVHRPSRCEHCSRTRLISQYSDCDSGIVEKCRPYKSSAARSSKHSFNYFFLPFFSLGLKLQKKIFFD